MTSYNFDPDYGQTFAEFTKDPLWKNLRAKTRNRITELIAAGAFPSSATMGMPAIHTVEDPSKLSKEQLVKFRKELDSAAISDVQLYAKAFGVES